MSTDGGKKRPLNPARVLLISFILVISLGTALLMLPYSTHKGISLVDAIFTATSSVCVTGLIVRSTPDAFTVFGQSVILMLIQIGGLGYMSMASLAALFLGRRLGLDERLTIRESLSLSSLEGITGFVKLMLMFVVVSEAAGAFLLTLGFARYNPMPHAAFLGLFHSVSAFNNAGFSLFNESLMGYRADTWVNLIVMSLIVVGGLGFFAIMDLTLFLQKKRNRLLLHTKIVVSFTTILVVSGAAFIYIAEKDWAFRALGIQGSQYEMVMTSLFSSITARTAGFNTIDYSMLRPVTLFLTIILMMIGASPGSTGGGMKTSTVAIVLAHIWQAMRGKSDTVLFNRRIPSDLIAKALVILALSLTCILVLTLAVMELEGTPFEETLFEVVSAFATVGLSTGNGGSLSLSALFSPYSKIIIILTMIAGRVGPLTLFTALILKKNDRIRYPEGKVMIG